MSRPPGAIVALPRPLRFGGRFHGEERLHRRRELRVAERCSRPAAAPRAESHCRRGGSDAHGCRGRRRPVGVDVRLVVRDSRPRAASRSCRPASIRFDLVVGARVRAPTRRAGRRVRTPAPADCGGRRRRRGCARRQSPGCRRGIDAVSSRRRILPWYCDQFLAAHLGGRRQILRVVGVAAVSRRSCCRRRRCSDTARDRDRTPAGRRRDRRASGRPRQDVHRSSRASCRLVVASSAARPAGAPGRPGRVVVGEGDVDEVVLRAGSRSGCSARPSRPSCVHALVHVGDASARRSARRRPD